MRHNDQSWTRDNATGNSYTDVLHGTLKLGACHSHVVTGNFLEKAARCQSRKQFVPLWSDGWKNPDVKEDGTSRRELYLLVIHEGLKMWNRRSSVYRIVFESNLFPDISQSHTQCLDIFYKSYISLRMDAVLNCSRRDFDELARGICSRKRGAPRRRVRQRCNDR